MQSAKTQSIRKNLQRSQQIRRMAIVASASSRITLVAKGDPTTKVIGDTVHCCNRLNSTDSMPNINRRLPLLPSGVADAREQGVLLCGLMLRPHTTITWLQGIPFDTELVDLTKPRPQWLIDVNQGKVPVIKVPGGSDQEAMLVPDSDRIVVFLEEKFPDVSMRSTAPEGMGSKVFPAFKGYLQCPPEEQEAKKAALVAELAPINAYLSEQGRVRSMTVNVYALFITPSTRGRSLGERPWTPRTRRSRPR